MTKVKSTVPAHRTGSGAMAVAESPATNAAQLSTDELRALLTGSTRCAIAEQIATVLARGPIERALGAWIDMYTLVLRSFCRVTSFSEDPTYRLDANAKLPRAAANLLLTELELGGKLQQIELTMARDALELVQTRRGKQAVFPACLVGTFPARPSPTSQHLGLHLNVAASQVIAEWEACPPCDEEAIDLARLWLVAGDRYGIDRRREWKEWRTRLAKAGRTCPMDRFYEEARVTHARFHEGWLGGRWSDDSEQGQRVLEVMTRPIANWPLKSNRGR